MLVNRELERKPSVGSPNSPAVGSVYGLCMDIRERNIELANSLVQVYWLNKGYLKELALQVQRGVISGRLQMSRRVPRERKKRSA